MSEADKVESIKVLVEKFVEARQGCKATELAVDQAISISCDYVSTDLSSIIEEMVRQGRLVEIEYTLSSMDYRVKSFLLPPNTRVKLRELI